MKVLDGGFGTTLRDIFNNSDKKIWSLRPIVDKNYKMFTDCHKLFIDAGCDAITTGNYCATPYYLSKIGGSSNDLKDYILKIADLSHSLKKYKDDLIIAGCVPPYAESYDPDNSIPLDKLRDHYSLTGNCLMNTSDFYLAETISSLREAKTIYECLGNSNIPLYMSFCVDTDGVSLLDGSNINKVLQSIDYNIKGVMFNCSPVYNINKAVINMNRHLVKNNINIELGCYPNLLQKIPKNFKLDTDNKFIYSDLSSDQFCEYGINWNTLHNVKWVGGCCSIPPSYIKKLNMNRYKVLNKL